MSSINSPFCDLFFSFLDFLFVFCNFFGSFLFLFLSQHCSRFWRQKLFPSCLSWWLVKDCQWIKRQIHVFTAFITARNIIWVSINWLSFNYNCTSLMFLGFSPTPTRSCCGSSSSCCYGYSGSICCGRSSISISWLFLLLLRFPFQDHLNDLI